jgi:hypothetical protein
MAQTQWYITKYARLLNREVELISYTKAPNFDVACGAEHINLPNNQFYHAENCVGSLLPKFKPYWVARDVYSHKAQTAQLQAEAEIKAQHIIDAVDVDFADTMKAMKDLNGLLTKVQYDVVFQSVMRKPSVIKYLYERSE